MSFGLRNAPATFQRLMNLVVAGLGGCAVYLDDVVVDHLQHIGALFSRLAEAHLTVNLAKCEFARATVTYLGQVVGQGQVRPVDAKVRVEVYVGFGSSPVVVYTDHNLLTFLCSLSCPNRRLMRWTLFLQSYSLDIRHIKGKANVVADALSCPNRVV